MDVLKSFKNVFPIPALPGADMTKPAFLSSDNSMLVFVPGAKDKKFSFTTNVSFIAAQNDIIFFAEGKDIDSSPETKISYPLSDATGNPGLFANIAFKAKGLGLANSKLSSVPGTTGPFRVGYVFAPDTVTAYGYQTFLLGISTAEFNTLNALSGFATNSKRYINMVPVKDAKGSTDMDKNFTTYYKCKLVVSGYKDNGQVLDVEPTTPVYVYSLDMLAWNSPDFNTLKNITVGAYQRNFEEHIGEMLYNGTTTTYEDHFINLYPGLALGTEVTGFIQDIAALADDNNLYKNLSDKIQTRCTAVWNKTTTFVQAQYDAHAYSNVDDRPLYWARIKMAAELKKKLLGTGFQYDLSDAFVQRLIRQMETFSRHYAVNFAAAPATAKKILITGFDPFQLNPRMGNPEQSNPSGIAALLLSGKTITNSSGKTAYIQTAIVPVRYPDFDANVVENLVSPLIKGNKVSMIVSMSLNGNAYYFDLERFAVKARGGFMDNLNIGSAAYAGYGAETGPFNTDIGTGNAVYETKLPSEAIVTSAVANNFNVRGQRIFFDQSIGNDKASADVKQPIYNLVDSSVPNSNQKDPAITGTDQTYGSGGDYLSNEIFYRIARVREQQKSTVKTGHYHVAEISGIQSGTWPQPPGANLQFTRFTQEAFLAEIIDFVKRALNGL